jgi:hypothetical protein
MMAAGFETDVRRLAADRGSGIPQRRDFGMRPARKLVPAPSGDPLAVRDHAADPGIGIGGVKPATREAQRLGHAFMIEA